MQGVRNVVQEGVAHAGTRAVSEYQACVRPSRDFQNSGYLVISIPTDSEFVGSDHGGLSSPARTRPSNHDA